MFVYPEIVIGGCIESLRYALDKKAILVYADILLPHFFEKNTAHDWSELCFFLSVNGWIPFGESVDTLRVDTNEQRLDIFIGPRKFEAYYNKLTIFSDKNLRGLPDPIEIADEFQVLDWFDVKEGMSHSYDSIIGEGRFVQEIYFYPTKRLDGNHLDKKDAVAVSYMSGSELKELGWSDNYARLKTTKLMEGAGITGGMIEQGRHRAIRVEHAHREVVPIKKNRYEDIPNVEFR